MVIAIVQPYRSSFARKLGEGARVHKRLEIIVKNPGFEGTEQALGSLTLDFEDPVSLSGAIEALGVRLSRSTKDLPVAVILENEKGEMRGFNPAYYVSHRIDDAANWDDTWVLPTDGSLPPPRENGDGS